MDEPDSAHTLQIEEPQDQSRRYTVDLAERNFLAYPIMDEELDSFASAHSSVNQVFLGIFLGALMSVFITFGTGGVTEANQLTYTWIAGGLVLASLYFGIMSILDVLSARGRVKRIRQRGKGNGG